MIPKGQRLSRTESSRADREGFRASVGVIQARVLPLPEAAVGRYVVIAGKAASKSSVDRHTIRRRVAAAMNEAVAAEGFRGDAVVRVRADVSKRPFEDLVADCKALLRRR